MTKDQNLETQLKAIRACQPVYVAAKRADQCLRLLEIEANDNTLIAGYMGNTP